MNYNNQYQKKSLLNTPLEYFNKEGPNFSAFENINKGSNRNGLLPTPPLKDSYSSQPRNIYSSESYCSMDNIYLESNKDRLLRNDDYEIKDSNDGLLPLPNDVITDMASSNFSEKFNLNVPIISKKKSRFSDSITPSEIENIFENSKRKIDQNDFTIKDKQIKKSRFQDSIDFESVKIDRSKYVSNSDYKDTARLDLKDMHDLSKKKSEFESKDIYKTSINDKNYKIPINSIYENIENNNKIKVISTNFNKISDGFYRPHKIDKSEFASDDNFNSGKDDYVTSTSINLFNKTSDDIYKSVDVDRANNSLVRGRIRYHAPQKVRKDIKEEIIDLSDTPKEVLSWQTLIHKTKYDEKISENDKFNYLSDNHISRFSSQEFSLKSDKDKCSTYGKDFIPGICEDVKYVEVSANNNLKIETETNNNKLLADQKMRLFELFKQCQKRALMQTANKDINFDKTLANNHTIENCQLSSSPFDNMTTDNLNSLSIDEIIGLYNETINNIFQTDSNIKLNEKDIEFMKSIQDTFNNTKLSLKDSSKSIIKNLPTKLDLLISEKTLKEQSTPLMKNSKNDKKVLSYQSNKPHDYKVSQNIFNNSTQYSNKIFKNNQNKWNKQRFGNRNDSRNNKRFDKFHKNKSSAGEGLLENPYIQESNLKNNFMNPIANVNPLNSMLINNQANVLQSNLALQLLAANLQNNFFNSNVNTNLLRKY